MACESNKQLMNKTAREIVHWWLGGVVVSVSDLRLKRSLFDSGLYHSGQQLWAGCVHLLAQWGVMLWPDSRAAAINIAYSSPGPTVYSPLWLPRSAQPSIPSWSVNEYQLRQGRQRQIWFIPSADKRVGVQANLWDPLTTCCRTWAL